MAYIQVAARYAGFISKPPAPRGNHTLAEGGALGLQSTQPTRYPNGVAYKQEYKCRNHLAR